MENCSKFLPEKSYNTFGLVLLTLFVSFGIVAIGMAGSFDSKATLQCNPDKTLASDLAARKYIDTQCFLKYAKEFNHSLPLHVLVVINLGIVLLLSIVYGYSVKHRVECFVDPPSSTTENENNAEDQRQPPMSKAASNPMDHQKNAGSYVVFTVYIIHLIVCRIIPLVVFAVLLLNSSNFPIEFQCSRPMKTRSTSYANVTPTQNTNFTIVDCTYPIGGRNEKLASTVVAVNFLYGAITFIELAYLLWSTWKDYNLLTDMEFCSVYILRKRKRIRKLIKKIREGISDDIFKLHDDFGETQLSRRKLEEMYVNVIIQDGRESNLPFRRQYKNRHEKYEAHIKAPAGTIVLTATQDLFKDNPRTILVVGRPGIGKTLLTTKIFYQWKQQAFKFWHDKMVILIRFRKINNMNISLREMLNHADGFNMSQAELDHIYEYICLKPNNVVLIFDGLDELKIDDEFLLEQRTVDSHDEDKRIPLIFKQLVNGALLPGVTVLATSRPTAEQIYNHLNFDRQVEILGFHKKQIKKYVENFCCHDLTNAIRIWNYIKDSPELLSLCYIPVNSYIVCLTLTETLKDHSLKETDDNFQSNVPRTITELYNRAIKILLFKHNLKYKGKQIPKDYVIAKLPEHLQNDLNKLKEIARSGMENNRLLFESGRDHAIVKELSNCGLFNQLDDKRKNVFCFLHLTIQEFLAAQHVVDDMENVESFLSDNIDSPRWHLVIQFVAGLIGEKLGELKAEKSISKRSAENWRIMGRICNRFQDWIPTTRRIDGTQNTLLVIKCVYEMQDVDVVKSIASSSNDDSEGCKEFIFCNLNIAPVESTALFEFLCYIKNLNKLIFIFCVMEDLVLRELGKLLTKDYNEITELDFSHYELTDEGTKYLADALKTDNCKLTELNICHNVLTDEGVKYLADAMKTDNCKLTELDISCNRLTDESAKYLADALKTDSCKLTELNIRDIGLTDEGAQYLADALKTDNCKLTKLDISGNRLTDEAAIYLADVLKTDNCKLTELHTGFNELTDEGAKYLDNEIMSLIIGRFQSKASPSESLV